VASEDVLPTGLASSLKSPIQPVQAVLWLGSLAHQIAKRTTATAAPSQWRPATTARALGMPARAANSTSLYKEGAICEPSIAHSRESAQRTPGGRILIILGNQSN
jgi:hypothetical protein